MKNLKKQRPMPNEERDKSLGLVAGYKPNPISLYILLLQTGRVDELMDKFYKDMEPYREDK